MTMTPTVEQMERQAVDDHHDFDPEAAAPDDEPVMKTAEEWVEAYEKIRGELKYHYQKPRNEAHNVGTQGADNATTNNADGEGSIHRSIHGGSDADSLDSDALTPTDSLKEVDGALTECIQKMKASDAIYAGQNRKQADYERAERFRMEAEHAEDHIREIVQGLEQWKEAVVDCLVTNWSLTEVLANDPRAAVNAIMHNSLSQENDELKDRIAELEADLAQERERRKKAEEMCEH